MIELPTIAVFQGGVTPQRPSPLRDALGKCNRRNSSAGSSQIFKVISKLFKTGIRVQLTQQSNHTIEVTVVSTNETNAVPHVMYFHILQFLSYFIMGLTLHYAKKQQDFVFNATNVVYYTIVISFH